MVAIAFDTLLFSHKLEEAGMSREQAEKFAEIQKEIVDAQSQALQETLSSHLATKEDIWDLKNEIHRLDKKILELDNKISLLRKEFQGKFTLLYWMNSFILAALLSIMFKLFL